MKPSRRELFIGGSVVAIAASMPRVAFAQSQPSRFVMNGLNTGNYGVGVYDLDGQPNPTVPIIETSNNGGAIHSAWPSAYEKDGSVFIQSHRYYNGGWQDIVLHEATPDFSTISMPGLVLSKIAGEDGIGPGHGFYDASSQRPFKYICLSRRPNGDFSKMFLASSETGLAGTWQRDGIVFEADQTWEATVVVPNFVHKLSDGRWALHYSASGGGVSHSAIAYVNTLGDTFSDKKKLYSSNGVSNNITGAVAGFSIINVSGAVRIGEPYVAYNTSGQTDIVRPVKQVGGSVYFDRPIDFTYQNGSTLAHFGRVGVGFKYVWEEDGVWRAWATCNHMVPVMREYVGQLSAPALEGPWEFDPVDIVFKPWNGRFNVSCENPSPIRVIS